MSLSSSHRQMPHVEAEGQLDLSRSTTGATSVEISCAELEDMPLSLVTAELALAKALLLNGKRLSSLRIVTQITNNSGRKPIS
jgi:hypothetical protein